MKSFGKMFAASVFTSSLAAVPSLFAQNSDPWYSGQSSGFWGVSESIGFHGVLPPGFGLAAHSEGLSAVRQLGGYRISDSLSIEGMQTSFGLKGSACGGDVSSGAIGCLGSAWSLAGVATLPLESGFALYGRFGLHFWKPGLLDEQAGPNGTADRRTVYGMGMRYGLTRSITLHAESEFHNEFYGASSVGLRLSPGLFDSSVHSIGLSINF